MLLQSPNLPPLIEDDLEDLPAFESTEYRDPPLAPHRPERWYNGSQISTGSYPNGELFSRLRTLHTTITSRETGGYQLRESHYRHVGNLLAGFFPVAVLDALVENLLAVPKLRLPRPWEQAVSIVLAAMELYLRKTQRRTIREQVVRQIARELDLPLSMRKLGAAKLFLLKAGFMEEDRYEIVTSTYEVLRTLVVDVATETAFPPQAEPDLFHRRLYQECLRLIRQLEGNRRRPQHLEVCAHAIVSHATETLLDIKFYTSAQLENPDFQQRVYRAKCQLLRMLEPIAPPAPPVVQQPVAISYTEFEPRLRTVVDAPLAPAMVHVAWGEGLSFEVVGELFEAQNATSSPFSLMSFWITFILLQILTHHKLSRKTRFQWPSTTMNNVTYCFTDDSGPGPPGKE